MQSDEKRAHGKIAIIGMSCLFPGSPDLASYWSNLVSGKDCLRDVSDREWNPDDYYDPSATAFGKSYSKRGGFISEYAEFDPLKFGVMPSGVAGSDPDQFLTLKVAYEAMEDAGYLNREFDRDRAEIILGRISAPGAGSMNLIHQSKTVSEISDLLKNLLPGNQDELIESVVGELKQRLVACNSDTIPGAMPNVLAGRIAAKLGFRGRNLLIDAACASSMVAVETAVNDLLSGQCDFALAGGLHVNASNVFFQMFCGLGALSRTDEIRPFDENADGTLLGEGIGIICLKRYEDALVDGDRIYATICGVASSSDGHGGSVLSPNLEGEALAMEKAYRMAGVSPRTIGLLEAHGTGTPTGDVVELQAVEKAFKSIDEEPYEKPWCAVGSVKSMIGHCQSASAVAGIIKAALALHHKILPPTLNVTRPNSKINWDEHPCYINTQARPWIHPMGIDHPRRAAVSAFGFGGINGHLVLEETPEDPRPTALMKTWPAELFTFCAESQEVLLDSTRVVAEFVHQTPQVNIKDLAYTLNCSEEDASACDYRLAIVAGSAEELTTRLEYARKIIPTNPTVNEPEKGVFFTKPGTAIGGKMAFLYPGLGSAYTGMLSDLCLHFPEVRMVFDIVDTVAKVDGVSDLPSQMIFPSAINGSRPSSSESLASADFAVVAVLLAEYALHYLLQHLDVNPDVLMGCSTGEFAAITTGGAVDVLSVAQTFFSWSVRVARSIPVDNLSDLRSLRILASAKIVMEIAGKDVHLSADLGDKHIIVTGTTAAITTLSEKLSKQKIVFQFLPTAIPYHTPLVKNLVDTTDDSVTSVDVKPLSLPTWACSTGALYPDDAEKLRPMFTELFTKPVRLRETIKAMYEEGVRKFIEVGPNGVLTTLVEGILADVPHLAMPANLASRPATTQIQHLLGALYVEGNKPNFEFLYQRRAPVKLDLKASKASAAKPTQKLSLIHTRLEVSQELICDQQSLQRPQSAGSPPIQPQAIQGDNSSPHTEDVLSAFLNTNSEFYSRMASAQQRVMTAFLSSAPQDDVVEPQQYSFQSRFEISRSGDSSVLELRVDLNQDLYLLDHAIGGSVTTEQNGKVYLMPLMVSLEIMAQAANIHSNYLIRRVEQVKAYKRIVVDHDGVVLKLVVNADGERAHVQMFDEADSIILESTFIFGPFSNECLPSDISIEGHPVSKLKDRSQLYTANTMFHGPRMQSVVSLDTIGNRSISGRARSDEARHWMPDQLVSKCLLHPLLLDNSSQFVLFYLYEKSMPAIALLPFFVESIDFFSAHEQLPPVVEGRALLNTVSDRATEAKVEVVDGAGSIWMRISGINSRRISLSESWIKYVHDPINSFVGTSIATDSEVAAKSILCEVTRKMLPDDEAVIDWCLDYLLTKKERSYFRENLKFEKRRVEWLLGRIAAKEAVRRLIKRIYNKAIGPLDIEIGYDDRKPIVTILAGGIKEVLVSISHSGEIGVALASFSSDGCPGIDVETIEQRDLDFAARFLSIHELEYLENQPSNARSAELTRMWSAKETAYKSMGGKVEMTAFSIELDSIQAERMSLCDRMSGTTCSVYTRANGDQVYAYTLNTSLHAMLAD